jgi:hypothetical protein
MMLTGWVGDPRFVVSTAPSKQLPWRLKCEDSDVPHLFLGIKHHLHPRPLKIGMQLAVFL